MLVGILIILGIVVLDQVTKLIILNTVPYGQSIEVIPNFFDITHRVNSGAAWSIFEGQMLMFYGITIVALVIFGYYFKDIDFKNKTVYSLGISILIGGTIGNFIDRIRIQGVIDFLDFKIFGYDFPVFNVADMALNVGIFLFILAVLFFDKD